MCYAMQCVFLCVCVCTREFYQKEYSDLYSHSFVSDNKLHLIGILKRSFFFFLFSSKAPKCTNSKITGKLHMKTVISSVIDCYFIVILKLIAE